MSDTSPQELRRKALFYTSGEQPMETQTVLGLTRLYGVSAQGEVSANSRPLDFDYFKAPAFSRLPADREHEYDLGVRRPLHLSHGAGCVLGQPDCGKTLFATTLAARNEGIEVIRFQEPEDDAILYEAAFVQAFSRALESASKLIFVDSLRTTFYTSSGTTGKGGVNMGIFQLLTAYDILARRAGKTILFALNPMTNDSDAIAFYLDAARGAVSHTLHATAPTKLRVSSRGFKNRAWIDATYEPPASQSSKEAAEKQRKAKPIDLNTDARDSIIDLYTITR